MALSLRVYTGTNAGTESTAQTGIDLISADNATNSAPNRAANEVAPGTNSFEKWLRLRLDGAGAATDFWFQNNDEMPDGVVLKMGIADTGVTPTASTSTVATTTVQAGRHYIWDTSEYSEAGEHTRYLVLQLQVAADADSGSIPELSPSIGWTT